jgi:hypothetical protein
MDSSGVIYPGESIHLQISWKIGQIDIFTGNFKWLTNHLSILKLFA